MSLCIATALFAVGLGTSSFTLSWTHSVEHTEWVEAWQIQDQMLVLQWAKVRGSGAGMEPPEGARMQDGWWVYQVPLRVAELRLASSGATGSGWRLCTAVGCNDIEALLSVVGQRPDVMRVHSGAICRPERS